MDAKNSTTDLIAHSNSGDDLEILDDSTYIWVPFLVLLGILVLSALVYLMARNRRDIKQNYCKRNRARRYYIDDNFDADVEQRLLSDTGLGEDRAEESLLAAKLQINNLQYETFDTATVSIAGANNNNHNHSITI